ncbi:hypothetical protein JCM18882A_26770 [Brevibacterium metallidurans]|uniref:Uncharacterized protein n=2 Tax=Brevibacterium TaxID=1696 RepID=A0ABP9U3R1_9MICO
MHRWMANAAGGISQRLKSFGAMIAERESTEAMRILLVSAAALVAIIGEGKSGCVGPIQTRTRTPILRDPERLSSDSPESRIVE